MRATSAQQIDASAPGLVEPLGDVAFAAAVMGGVDGEAECLQPVGDGLLDMLLDETPAAADIELEQGRAGGGGADLGLAALRDRTGHHRNAKAPSTARRRDGAFGVAGLEPADRGEQHRKPRRFAEQGGGAVDRADIAQHPGAQRDGVQRLAVACDGGLGLGATDDVVPAIGVEPLAGGGGELMQGQELGLQITLHRWRPFPCTRR
jgi:hypothetical protein